MTDADWAVVAVSAVAAAAAIVSVIYTRGAVRAAKESAASAAKLADVEHARWHQERRPSFEATWESDGTAQLNSPTAAGFITLQYLGPGDGVDEVRAWLPQGDWTEATDTFYRELSRPISAGYPWTMPHCTMTVGDTFILVDAGPADDGWSDIRVDLRVPGIFVY